MRGSLGRRGEGRFRATLEEPHARLEPFDRRLPQQRIVLQLVRPPQQLLPLRKLRPAARARARGQRGRLGLSACEHPLEIRDALRAALQPLPRLGKLRPSAPVRLPTGCARARRLRARPCAGRRIGGLRIGGGARFPRGGHHRVGVRCRRLPRRTRVRGGVRRGVGRCSGGGGVRERGAQLVDDRGVGRGLALPLRELLVRAVLPGDGCARVGLCRLQSRARRR